jgi:hypothetical protein
MASALVVCGAAGTEGVPYGGDSEDDVAGELMALTFLVALTAGWFAPLYLAWWIFR